MGKTSYDFLEVLRDTIDDKVSTLDQTIYCKIVGVNEDYTLDVTVLPDDHTRIKSVVNASKYVFNVVIFLLSSSASALTANSSEVTYILSPTLIL